MKSVYVITGAASTGKTTIINELRKRGILCQDELARPLITELSIKKSPLVPWIDLNGFNDLLLTKFIEQYNNLPDKVQFLDRGIPDIVGYLKASNIKIPLKYDCAVHNYKYNKKVFFTEPWREIYGTDSERKESFETNMRISNCLKEAYIIAGYDIYVVPKLPVNERVDFIKKSL